MNTTHLTADDWQDAIHFAFRAESDRGAALVAAAMLDEALRALLTKRLVPPVKEDRSLLRKGVGPLSSFSAKVDAAYQLGLVSQYMARDLHLIRSIRNHFAHHALDCTFQTSVIRDWVSLLEKSSDYNQRAPETRANIGPPGTRWDFLGIVSWILYALNRALEDMQPIHPRGPEFGYIDWHSLPDHVRQLLSDSEDT